MDPRGYTSDPNAPLGQAKWWEDLGSTLGRQPYEDRDWVYLQEFKFEEIETLYTGIYDVYDNGTDIAVYLYPVVLNGGTIGQPRTGAVDIDSGGFTDAGRTEFVRSTLAEIVVYDSEASRPSKGLISNVSVDGQPATFLDDTIPGQALGRLDYSIRGDKLEIENWNHYGWYNSEPVVKAFQSMMVSIPKSVRTIEVANTPDAFWIAQGFRRDEKGTLVLNLSRPMPRYSSF